MEEALMQDDEVDQKAQSFIVRIWQEAARRKGSVPAWRGSIIHVGSGKRVYFHNLDGIKRFVQEWTGTGLVDSPGWIHRLLRRFNWKKNWF
jgi:hypothetical protein